MNKKDEALRMAIEAYEKESKVRELKYYEVNALYACKDALSEPVTLPDGWVAVPVEPTAWMVEQGDAKAKIHNSYSGEDSYIENTDEVYKAMLQAALRADRNRKSRCESVMLKHLSLVFTSCLNKSTALSVSGTSLSSPFLVLVR